MEKLHGTIDKLAEKIPGLNDFKKVQLAQKILQFINVAALIVAAIVRFVYTKNITSFSGYAITFYLLLFAAIFICHEISVAEFRVWFHFLNFGWGKSTFYLVISSVCLGSGMAVEVLDIIIGVWFALCAVATGIISIVYRNKEVELVDEMLKEIEQKKKEKRE